MEYAHWLSLIYDHRKWTAAARKIKDPESAQFLLAIAEHHALMLCEAEQGSFSRAAWFLAMETWRKSSVKNSRKNCLRRWRGGPGKMAKSTWHYPRMVVGRAHFFRRLNFWKTWEER